MRKGVAVVESYPVDVPNNEANSTEPLGIWAAIVKGFERVAARPILLVPLIILDLLLWFGPHLSLANMIPEGIAWMGIPDASDPAIAGQVQMVEDLIGIFRERFNLLSALSPLPGGMPFNLLVAVGSLPAGLPSLMAGQLPIKNPLGSVTTWYLEGSSQILLLWVVLTVVGLGLGAFYHRRLARETAPQGTLASGWLAWGRMILLFLIAYVGGLAALTLVVLVGSFLGLVHPLLSTVFIIVGIGLLFWAAIYLAFTAHGIVRYDFGVLRAMLESAFVVRVNLLSASGFLFVAFLVIWLSTTQIWSLPGEGSWYNLLSVLGHAFVCATLLTASYVYYQSRRTWARQTQVTIASGEDQAGGTSS
jgi:hypothetical protein